MALASFEISRLFTDSQRSGSSIARSVASETCPLPVVGSAGFSESAQYMQELVRGMLAWKTFITAIKTEPENIEKEIVVFLPAKNQRIVQARVRQVTRASILITDDDLD